MCWMHTYIKNALQAFKNIPDLVLPVDPSEAEIRAFEARKRMKYFIGQDFEVLHTPSSVEMFDCAIALWVLRYITHNDDLVVRAVAQKVYNTFLAQQSRIRRCFSGSHSHFIWVIICN